MQTLSVIGNLGVDATVQVSSGVQFLTFKVADTNVYTDKDGIRKENTTWVSCIYSGKFDNILPYLRKGTKVFVTGRPSYRVYSSEKLRCMVAGVDLHVMQIELCGGGTRDEVPAMLYDKDGIGHSVVKKYILTSESLTVPCQLTDERSRPFDVTGNHEVTPVVNG